MMAIFSSASAIAIQNVLSTKRKFIIFYCYHFFSTFVTTNLVQSNFCLLLLVGTANKMNESSVLATR